MPAGKARWQASSTPRAPPWGGWGAGAGRERMRAAIGPCIGRCSYEVGPEFPAPFLAQDEANGAFFRQAPRAGHFLFDLAGYLAHRIARIGVAADVTGHDTLPARADFFTYRRNTLKGVRDYGRGLSAIALRASRALSEAPGFPLRARRDRNVCHAMR